MNLRGCHSSHYIRSIKGGIVKNVHNMDSYGRPGLKFKKIEDIYQNIDADYNNSLPIAERKAKAGNGYVAEKSEPDCILNESNIEELTLSQFKKRCKRIKRKASEPVLLTPKAENDDDIDLTEPLCNFRVKATKISRSKTMAANGNIPTSSRSKDHATVNVKVEAPKEEYLSEHGETTCMVGDSSIFVASESGFILVSHGAKSSELGLFNNEGEFCELNEVSYDILDNIKNMEVDNEEYVTIDNDSFTKVPTTTTSDCSLSQLYFQQTPELVNISGVQDSDSMIDSPTLMSDYLCLPSTSHIWPTPDDHDEDVVSVEAKSFISDEKQHLASVHTDADANSFDFDNNSVVSKDMSFGQDSDSIADSPSLMPDNLCLISKSHICLAPDNHDEDVVSMEPKSSAYNEKQLFTSVHTDADSFDFDNNSVVSKDMSFGQDSDSMVDSPSLPKDSDSMVDSPSLMPDNLCLISKSHIWLTSDDHDEDVVSMEPNSSVYNKKQHFTSVHTDAESFDFDNNSVVSKDMSFGQDSDSIIDSPTLMSDYSCLPSTSHIWPTPDGHEEDVVSMEAKSSISNEKQHLASVHTDADANSFDFDNSSVVSKDMSFGQDSDSLIDSPTLTPDYLCLPLKSHIWPTPDVHDEDVVSMEVKSSISNEQQHSTSMNTDADANSFSSDNNSFVSKDISILKEQPSIVPANGYSEVDLDHNNPTDASAVKNSMGIRQPERLPLTRKVISPNSQEKLCQAMKSAESLDDMDHYKCKEKLYFGEQAENKYTSNKSDDDDDEPNVHPQQATQFIQNKVIINPKHAHKRPKNYKKKYSTNKCAATKGSLDGPRLCRSLPGLSTGCTSIAGCSESAIAFSQRQMHDIETLASKLMSELDSMKSIVEEKMLYEAYRSSTLKNETDEVKSAIKSATKTGETAKKWLSMMARDCSRFCKIMKLNEDNTSASTPDADCVSGNTNQEKSLQKERKKISFADEAGGTLCDIKVFQIERDSLELNEINRQCNNL